MIPAPDKPVVPAAEIAAAEPAIPVAVPATPPAAAAATFRAVVFVWGFSGLGIVESVVMAITRRADRGKVRR